MPSQPVLDGRGLVRGDVVENEVNVEFVGHLPLDDVQELSELDGAVTLEALGEDCRAREDVLALTRRVVHVADEALGAGFDGHIEITLRDGRAIGAPAPAGATDREKIVAKFRANAAAALTDDRIEAVIDILRDTGGIDVAALAPHLAAAVA